MVTLAQRITELREERGMSRPALAQALGFPKPASTCKVRAGTGPGWRTGFPAWSLR